MQCPRNVLLLLVGLYCSPMPTADAQTNLMPSAVCLQMYLEGKLFEETANEVFDRMARQGIASKNLMQVTAEIIVASRNIGRFDLIIKVLREYCSENFSEYVIRLNQSSQILRDRTGVLMRETYDHFGHQAGRR